MVFLQGPAWCVNAYHCHCKHNGMQGWQCQENGEEDAEPSLLKQRKQEDRYFISATWWFSGTHTSCCLLGRMRSLKEFLFCALLVSITTECKQSQTVMQNGTVVLRGSIQPLAARATAEKVASCQADKPSAGSACPFTKGHTLSASWMLWSSALRFHNYPHAARITDHNALYICEARELPKCIVWTQCCRRFWAFNGEDQYYRMIMVYDGLLSERDIIIRRIRRWMSVSYVLDNNIRWLSRTYIWEM